MKTRTNSISLTKKRGDYRVFSPSVSRTKVNIVTSKAVDSKASLDNSTRERLIRAKILDENGELDSRYFPSMKKNK